MLDLEYKISLTHQDEGLAPTTTRYCVTMFLYGAKQEQRAKNWHIPLTPAEYMLIIWLGAHETLAKLAYKMMPFHDIPDNGFKLLPGNHLACSGAAVSTPPKSW